MGLLMTRLETVYLDSYAGLGANKYMLSHAIAETHSIIKRLHSIVRWVWSGSGCGQWSYKIFIVSTSEATRLLLAQIFAAQIGWASRNV